MSETVGLRENELVYNLTTLGSRVIMDQGPIYTQDNVNSLPGILGVKHDIICKTVAY